MRELSSNLLKSHADSKENERRTSDVVSFGGKRGRARKGSSPGTPLEIELRRSDSSISWEISHAVELEQRVQSTVASIHRSTRMVCERSPSLELLLLHARPAPDHLFVQSCHHSRARTLSQLFLARLRTLHLLPTDWYQCFPTAFGRCMDYTKFWSCRGERISSWISQR